MSYNVFGETSYLTLSRNNTTYMWYKNLHKSVHSEVGPVRKPNQDDGKNWSSKCEL